MIGIALIIGTVVALSVFWDDFVNFLKNTINEIKKIVTGIIYGTKVFIKNIGNAIREIARYYYKKNDKWYEKTYTREVSPDEVPPDILKKAKQTENEVDITQQLEMQLSN